MENSSSILNFVSSLDLKKEYVEVLRSGGVMQRLMEILHDLMLNKNRPRNPLAYIKRELGLDVTKEETIIEMERILDDKLNEVLRLKRILDEIETNQVVEKESL